MNVLPVITRELRAQARQPFTYWLRLLGVMALLGGGLMFTFDHSLNPNRGAALFGYLHLTLFCAVWILVPLGAADCLSRERREGTLGLLFLTPLKPWDIVTAKGLTHGLRALTLLVAVVPVLTIPFLLGGVSWQQATASAIINFSAICWALAAALLASASARSGLRAMAAAVLLAAVALLAHGYFTGVLLGSKIGGNWRGSYSSLDFNLMVGFAASGLHPQAWSIWTGAAPMINAAQLLTSIVQSAGVSLLALVLAVLFAASRVRRSWQEEPPSARMRRMEKVFLQPVLWVSFLKRWMRWKLERNPIGWLEQRRWSGRLVTWTWFAIIISVQSAALTDRNFFHGYSDWQALMAWLLAGSMAASAAGSFRQERETGVLELLLVSPLKTTRIIGGRLRGLWGQFLPSIVLLLGVWAYFDSIFPQNDNGRQIVSFAVTYATLPVVGLYFSVRCRHFITAFLLTLGVTLALPVLLDQAARFLWWFYYLQQPPFISWRDQVSTTWAVQLILAGFFWHWLNRKLETRSFPLERGLA